MYARLLPLAFLLTACNSMGGLRAAPVDNGTARTYVGSYSKVLLAAREALAGANLDIQEASEIEPGKTYMLIAKKGMSQFSFGEMVRVVVHKMDRSHTEVRVVTKRRGKLNVFAKGDYSKNVLDQVAMQMKT